HRGGFAVLADHEERELVVAEHADLGLLLLQDEGAQDDVEAERAVFEVGVEGDPVGDLGAVPAVASGADEFDEVFVVLGHRRPPIGPRPVISAPCSPWFWGWATL